MTSEPTPRPTWALRIREEREARKWTIARAAGYLHRRDPHMPTVVTLAKYWAQRWESGRIKPGPRYRHHLCALLGLPAAIFEDEREHAPAVHYPHHTLGPTVEGDAVALTGEELVVMAANESGERARRHGTSNVHPVTLEQLEADLRVLAVDFVSGLPVPALLRARAARDEVFTLLDGQQWPSQTRQLYSLAGWACGLLSVASSDFFGRYDAAATQGRTAWLCAEMSGDVALQAWVRALQSGIAFWAGRWSQAAELAAQARQYASTAPAAMRAATAQARALARLGDAEGTRRAILDAESARDLPCGEDEPGVLGFTPANSIRCAGTAQLWIGDYTNAQSSLQDALLAYERDEPDAYAHLTVTRADLASAYLHAGDVEAAADAIAPVLSLTAERRLAGVTRRTAPLRAQLADPRYRNSATARDLAERIEALPAGVSTLGGER